jgi:CheY-like chemotaxis protein
MNDINALRFLAVENDQLHAHPISSLLRGMGARHALAATDAARALDLLEAAHGAIDIVVADLDANCVDALALVHGMAKRRHRAALIVATAFPPPAAAGVEVVARDYGVRWLGTLQKPLTARKLREAIASRTAREGTAVPDFLRRKGEA